MYVVFGGRTRLAIKALKESDCDVFGTWGEDTVKRDCPVRLMNIEARTSSQIEEENIVSCGPVEINVHGGSDVGTTCAERQSVDIQVGPFRTQ